MPQKKIYKSISTVISALYNSIIRQTDHKRLTSYIIELNKKESFEAIINELARCLKDILNYRLFGFVSRKNDTIDVWLDPKIYRSSLEDVILNDFSLTDRCKLNYLNHPVNSPENDIRFSMAHLISYGLDGTDFKAKIYILPDKGLSDWHDEVINIILKSTQVALSRQMDIERLTDAAVIDPLTGCYNRRELENQLKKEVANSSRHKNRLAMFMVDIDHFKHINDTYGHPIGDLVLQKVVALIRNNIRAGDILARYGGEEFIAVLPETDKPMAIELANRLRSIIAETPVKTESHDIRVTASFGVASFTPATDMNKLIADADTMLYKAKLSGRNTVMPGLIKVCPPAGREKGN